MKKDIDRLCLENATDNSRYRFNAADKKLKAEWHPLAYMLILCDELQCPDKTAFTGKPADYMSGSNFAELFAFATVLNGMWGDIDAWRAAKKKHEIESFLSDPKRLEELRNRRERELQRGHCDMIPGLPDDLFEISAEEAEANYERLDKAEQDQDTDPMECMPTMLKMFAGL